VPGVLAVPVFPVHRYPETVNDDAKLPENSCDLPDAALADAAGTSRIGSDRAGIGETPPSGSMGHRPSTSASTFGMRADRFRPAGEARR
jgi:hypothetical protein